MKCKNLNVSSNINIKTTMYLVICISVETWVIFLSTRSYHLGIYISWITCCLTGIQYMDLSVLDKPLMTCKLFRDLRPFHLGLNQWNPLKIRRKEDDYNILNFYSKSKLVLILWLYNILFLSRVPEPLPVCKVKDRLYSGCTTYYSYLGYQNPYLYWKLR